MRTNFFEQMAGLQINGNLQINIQANDIGTLTVAVLLVNANPKITQGKSIPPMLLKGTPQELDEGFFGQIWYTPPKETDLFFSDSLGIPSGKTKIPALLWKATKERLQVFALKGKAKPNGDTPLYYAPLFNLSQDGSVCMGTVSINIDRQTHLEQFMAQWETYFFNSYFTHTLGSHRHCKGNLVQLWQEQVGTGREFPQNELIKNGKTIKDLIR